MNPILHNFHMHPTDAMYYILMWKHPYLQPFLKGLFLLTRYAQCKSLIPFPRTFPTELKGIAV